ncbi:MAG: LLM class flavin-dependent oxidoreductase, partial [Acidimicrobiia bacterium]|nr:LLM class flavin-dependent oxidoreductase [Acidimicrobiia bacterium]
MSAPMPFRFGVQTFNTVSAADWREQAVRAEGQGYDVLSVADHYIGAGPALEAAAHPVQDIACIPAMATALAATSTLRVGSRVIACDYHHPVVLAKSLVTLDYLSDGRFEPGLGAGWITSEYEAMGIEMMSAGRRIDKLVEVIDLVRATYRPGELDIDGEYVHAVGFEATPRPVQPAPPIMVGGGSPRVLGLAGRHADIVSINFDNSEGKLGAVGVG